MVHSRTNLFPRDPQVHRASKNDAGVASPVSLAKARGRLFDSNATVQPCVSPGFKSRASCVCGGVVSESGLSTKSTRMLCVCE